MTGQVRAQHAFRRLRWRPVTYGSTAVASLVGYNFMMSDEGDAVSGTPILDPAIMDTALAAIATARAVYRPKVMQQTDVEWFLPVLSQRNVTRFRVLHFHPAPGNSFRNENGLACHHCGSTFMIASLTSGSSTLRERIALVSSSKLSRYHCSACYHSVCGACSGMNEKLRVCSACQKLRPAARSEIQYGVMRLHEQRAIVVSFRGTKTRADIAIDAKTKPKDLLALAHSWGFTVPSAASDTPTEPANQPIFSRAPLSPYPVFSGSVMNPTPTNSASAVPPRPPPPHTNPHNPVRPSLLVHGGVVDQIALCYDSIKRHILEELGKVENRRLRLVLCGHSLGGGYASAFVLLALMDPELRPVMLKHDFQVLTFGSPRILFRDHSLEQGLDAIASAQGSSRAGTSDQTYSGAAHPFFERHFTSWVNEEDIVPRLLGNSVRGLGVAQSVLKQVANSLMSLQVHADELEDNLEHFEHVGRVVALSGTGDCRDIDAALTDDFFSMRGLVYKSAIAAHMTAEYERRIATAFGRLTGMPLLAAEAEPGPAAAEQVAHGPEHRLLMVERDVAESVGATSSLALSRTSTDRLDDLALDESTNGSVAEEMVQARGFVVMEGLT
ncbi:uncharacterized protein MONBRDRAFT_9118 [Monosiga brevicollis MX1]|uniref:Fungal lipase-type domain-containing protein n=1 Tax=Monosiga brevicollis TaxID=81824 RepID=A9V251_MONBE|nr:uncharacterized protein MONBRDRAFT_9118 [Monosiga brevicollis MX1]EDQ88192.1 predicted protein [Monosiga brevicollis MX1]|eukprot:XP_001746785.1 hypothetical protein [Monosiga brevicollis MX1]